MMTLGGLAAQKLAVKRKEAQIAAAFPNGVRCQKCLEYGHWSYECSNKRKFAVRSSRTKLLNKNIAEMVAKREGDTSKSVNGEPDRKKRKRNDSTSSSSSSSSSTTSSSSSSSSSSSDSSSSSNSSSSDSDSSQDSNSSDQEKNSKRRKKSSSDSSSSSESSADSANDNTDKEL